MPDQKTVKPKRFSSIRERLIIAFLLIILIPMLVVSTVLTVAAAQNIQSQQTYQLQTVTSYKKAAIQDLLTGFQSQLRNSIRGDEVNQQLNTLLSEQPDSAESQEANLYLKSHFKLFLTETGQFISFLVLNTEGEVVLSTDPVEEGKNYKNEVFFQGSQFGPFTQLSSFTQTIIVTNPLTDGDGNTIGYVAGKARTATLDKILQNPEGLGETGQTYLVSLGRVLLTNLPDAKIGDTLVSPGIVTALEKQSNGVDSYTNFRDKAVFGVYDWIPEIRVAIIAEVEQAEVSGPVYAILFINFGVALAAISIAVFLSLRITRAISKPINNLVETATQIADGHLELEASVGKIDEIARLAGAFNNMTSQLRQTLENLELRVEERTNDLEKRSQELENQSAKLAEANSQVERRILQMEAISRVAKSIASVQNLQELLPFVTKVISEQFGFYHAGIFLIDSANEFAVLSAANSEGGQKMLGREHKLKIGQTSIVGYVISTGKSRVVLDTEKDPVFSHNPDLPNTRAEMALPLKIGDRIIGALDVQSTEAGVFTEQDTEVLSTLADQVSIAIQNSRLFESTQKSLSEISTVYRQTIKETWAKTIEEQEVSGYKFGVTGHRPIRDELKTEGVKQAMEKDDLVVLQGNKEPELAIPIKLRGQTIGILNVRAPEGHNWKQNEINILRAVAERVAVSSENARLFEETTRRAERERTVSTITTKIRSTNDPEEMLAIAINEIKSALNAREIRIKKAETARDEN